MLSAIERPAIFSYYLRWPRRAAKFFILPKPTKTTEKTWVFDHFYVIDLLTKRNYMYIVGKPADISGSPDTRRGVQWLTPWSLKAVCETITETVRHTYSVLARHQSIRVELPPFIPGQEGAPCVENDSTEPGGTTLLWNKH